MTGRLRGSRLRMKARAGRVGRYCAKTLRVVKAVLSCSFTVRVVFTPDES